MLVPIGYVRRPSGEVIKDPDEQVQAVVELIFDQLEARGTISGVLRYLVDHGIQLPIRARSGASKGELEWHRPNRPTLSNMFHNPIYAGAYVYGRRPTDARRKTPGRARTGRTVASPGTWQVLLKERLPAYISWEQYEANLAQLAANRARALGAPRRGPALLSGLLTCGRCGRRMSVTYGGGYQRYTCSRDAASYGAKLCQSLAGRVLDEKVSALVIAALEPSSLEVSMRVAEDVAAERRRLEEGWQKRLERAQYEIDRAMRQYNAVEPENRLVARTLEKHLEAKLSQQKSLAEEHDRWLSRQPAVLSSEERQAIRCLAADIPALWAAATTTSADRQTIIRQLVDRIVVTVVGDTERVQVAIEWVGGHRTETAVVRPVARVDQLSYHDKLVERIRELREQGLKSHAIADRLNREAWRPPKRRPTFNGEMVRTIASRHGLTTLLARKAVPRPALRRNEWLLPALAAKLSMPTVTLYSWLCRGWIRGRRLDEPRRPWVIHADAQDIAKLHALRAAPKLGWQARTTMPLARA
jgi:hypothetical protein